MPGMLPSRRRSSRSYAYSTGADQSSFFRRTRDLAHDGRRVAQMVDQKRMANSRFDGFKRGFFDDGGVKRTPAYVSAVRNEAVIRPEHASMRFANRKDRIRTCNHKRTRFSDARFFARLACLSKLA